MTKRLLFFCLASIAGLMTAAFLASSAIAQLYPNRVIRLVIPFPAGSSVDVIGRLIAGEMTTALGQQVIIENRAGAGGNIAAEYVVGQPADGYTLFLGTTGNMATNKVLYRRLRFDPEVDLVPVSLLYASCNVLILSKDNPVKTLAELIDEAKRSPGKLTFGSPGVGTAGHLVGELFKVRTQTNLAHVPYRGQPQVMNDLMGGHLSMSFEAVGGAIPIILNGSVRGLATTCRERTKQLPDIPTFAELGISDFTLEALAMLAVNSKTPPEIVKQLHDVTVKIVTMPKITDRINSMGVLARTSTSAQARALLTEETARWRQVIEVAKIPPIE
jgi:tripartite-type tricarboxylate transporter receptor subunit TctC